jgi:hypothetical protein
MAAYLRTYGQDTAAPSAAVEPDQPLREVAALRLAPLGLQLFLVRARSEHPLIAQWPQKATCAMEKGSAWMRNES